MKKTNNKKMHILFNNYKKHQTSSNLERIYVEYKNLAYGIAFSFVKNKEATEDIVQNIFCKLFSMKKENLPDSNESSWFYTIIKNESLNFLKKNRDTIDIDEFYNMQNLNNDIDESIDIIYYNQITKKLSSEEKEIVNLKIICDLSFREISNLLNMPIATVEWKYYKAIKNVKVIIMNLLVFMITFAYGCVNIKTKEISENTNISKENNTENTNIENNTIQNELADRVPESPTNTIEEIGISSDTYETTYITNVGILSFIISLVCIISIIFNIKKNKKIFKQHHSI